MQYCTHNENHFWISSQVCTEGASVVAGRRRSSGSRTGRPPRGIEHYLVGGLFIGLGIAVIHLGTGILAGNSTFLETTLSYVSDLPRFQREKYVASRDWRVVFAVSIVAGGLLHGFRLAYSRMARPEIVLDFLRLEDLGLLFVMGGAALVTGLAIQLGTRVLETALLTGTRYAGREKGFDRNVVAGGIVFGVG